MAELVLVAGAQMAGAAIAGPVGAAIGGLMASALLRSMQPDTWTRAEVLENLTVSSATQGAALPWLWGQGRISGQIIVAQELQPHKEVTSVSGGKGDGPSHNVETITYTSTYAVCFGEARLSTPALRKVFSNKKITEDYSEGAEAVLQGDRMTWYDGTQTEPDADLVALIGEGNVPAYTGYMFGVYHDRDLTEFGNRPPSPEADICTSYTNTITPAALEVDTTTRGTTGGQSYCHSAQKLYCTFERFGLDNGLLVEIEPTTRQVIQTKDIGYTNDTDCVVISEYGSYGPNGLLVVNARNGDGLKIYRTTANLELVKSLSGTYTKILCDSEYWLLMQMGSQLAVFAKGTWIKSTITNPTSYTPGHSAVRLSASSFLVAMDDGSTFGVLTIDSGSGAWSMQTNTVTANDDGYGGFVDNAGRNWFPAGTPTSGGCLLQVDDDGTVLQEVILSDIGAEDWSGAAGFPECYYSPEADHVFTHSSGQVSEIDLDSLSVSTFSDGKGGNWSYYHNETGSCWVGGPNSGSSTQVHEIRLKQIEPVEVDVADIIDDIEEEVGIASASRDNSGITATVGGYLQSQQGSASTAIEHLLQYALAELVTSDWVVTAVPLGGSSAGTIDVQYLGAKDAGTTAKPPVIFDEVNADDLPYKFQVHYLSSDNDLQAGMQEYRSRTADSKKVASVTFPIVMSNSAAAELAQVFLQLVRQNKTVEVSLPPSYGKYEPTDVLTLPTDQGDMRIRLQSVDRGANGILRCKAASDSTEDLQTNAVAGSGGLTSQTIPLTGPAEFLYLDLPIVRDLDNETPGPYVTAFTYGGAFPGVAFMSSVDQQDFSNFAGSVVQPVVGICSTAPSEADYEDWDESNTLRVTLRTEGILSSATEAAVLAGANAFAWGAPGRWEICQFKTKTLISTGVYDVSDLLRGRRGTDGQMDSHTASDWFVLLTEQTIQRELLTISDIGSTRYYRAPIISRPVVDSTISERVVGDEPLQPYSPINIAGVDSSGDIDLTWDWRTRKGGTLGGANDLTDGTSTTTTDEDSGELRILDTDGTTVLDTYTVTGESHTYTAAQQADDYGSAPNMVLWQMRQDSATSGVEGNWSPVGGYAGDSDAWTVSVIKAVPDHWHRLGESSGTTATDLAGSDDGTYTGGYTLSASNTHLTNDAVTFNGATGYVQLGTNIVDWLKDEWTIEVLFKTSATANGAIYAEGRSNSTTNYLYIGTANSGADCYFKIAHSYSKVGTITHQDTGVNDGNWHYAVVVSHSLSDRRLYLDGVVADTSDTSTMTQTDVDQASIGALWQNGATSLHWDGEVDEVVRHDDRALSAGEILARWNALRV